MRFSFSHTGDRAVVLKFQESAKKASNYKPAFNRIADYLMMITGKQFSSSGRRGGGSWKQLTPRWLFRKAQGGFDTRILRMRNTLHDSVTRKGAAGQVLIIRPRTMDFGTKVPHAAVQQFGGSPSRIPARPFLKLIPTDKEHIRQEIEDHLMSAWKGGKRA